MRNVFPFGRHLGVAEEAMRHPRWRSTAHFAVTAMAYIRRPCLRRLSARRAAAAARRVPSRHLALSARGTARLGNPRPPASVARLYLPSALCAPTSSQAPYEAAITPGHRRRRWRPAKRAAGRRASWHDSACRPLGWPKLGIGMPGGDRQSRQRMRVGASWRPRPEIRQAASRALASFISSGMAIGAVSAMTLSATRNATKR